MPIPSDLCLNILDNLFEGVFLVDTDGRITYWNRGAERITGFKRDEVLGLRCSDNVLVHLDAIGNTLCATPSCPLLRAKEGPSGMERQFHIRHKGGHRVPVTTRSFALKSEDGELKGAGQVLLDDRKVEEAKQWLKEAQELALIDPLTGLGNRGYGEIQVQRSLLEMDRYGSRFGVFFMDLDRFKHINDTFGHEVGDLVLQTVARTVSEGLRASDMLFRWGGEEFLGLVLHMEPERLPAVGDKIRSLVEQTAVETDWGPGRVTVSIGATLARPEDTLESLVHRADRLMYESKKNGRNRLTIDLKSD